MEKKILKKRQSASQETKELSEQGAEKSNSGLITAGMLLYSKTELSEARGRLFLVESVDAETGEITALGFHKGVQMIRCGRLREQKKTNCSSHIWHSWRHSTSFPMTGRSLYNRNAFRNHSLKNCWKRVNNTKKITSSGEL
ncbi:MAG: hypothetical protein ACLRWH_04760 [Emergencia sp.]